MLIPLTGAVFMTFAVAGPPASLKVDGPRILNSRNEEVVLRGVNVACLEWSSDGEGHVLETIRVAIIDWKSNHVRLPLSQDRWFGKAPEQKDDGRAYRALVRQCVDLASKLGAYIMLDLHWNNAGEWGKNIGQHIMPDENSLVFWKDCARAFKNHPAVLFDLYNEPHDTTWDIWEKGGTITETRGVGARQGPFTPVTYRTPGMQALLDAVRGTGAKNICVIGGLDWSYDMSGFLQGHTLNDRGGNGLIYANHAYPFKGHPVEVWMKRITEAWKKIPIIVSEFGAQGRGAVPGETAEQWVQTVIDTMEKLKLNWTAWDLHPAAGPTLISDWKYTPTPFGMIVKQALAKR